MYTRPAWRKLQDKASETKRNIETYLSNATCQMVNPLRAGYLPLTLGFTPPHFEVPDL